MKHRPVVCAAVLASISAGPPSFADVATAEALFREGKELMEAKRYDVACPKLLESYKADPATGALLALALCYERAGKTASAWARYVEAAGRAKVERTADREKIARERAADLEPKLARLTVRLEADAAAVAGIEVSLDGEVIGRPTWNTAVPTDPGEHVVRARADGRRAFETRVAVADGATESVRVPVLALAPPREGGVTGPSGGAAAAPPSSALRTSSYVAGGAAVVAAGIGGVFALRAASANDDSMADCDGNACGPVGKQARLDALAAGDVATALFVASGVLLAGGVALFVLGRPRDAASASARVAAVAAVGGGGVSFAGRW